MKSLRLWFVLAVVASWSGTLVLAQQSNAPPAAEEATAEPEATPSASDDEQVIRANAEKYVELYNRRDSQGMADMWSPDAVYTDAASGEQYAGRKAIAEHFAYLFAGLEDAKLAVTVDSVEFVSPNVAIERGRALVTYSEHDPEESTYSAVHVKRDGGWTIDRITETPVLPPPPSHYEQLKPLEWLVGAWIDEDDSLSIETEVEWTKNQNFLRRSFAMTVEGEVVLSGVQIIGWDPNAECIRSWTFDSDGGFAEATWEFKDSAWHIVNKGTLPEGGTSTSVNLLTPIDENSFRWESLNREVDGEVLPNIEPVIIVRAGSLDEPSDEALSAESPSQAGSTAEVQAAASATPDQ
jgi:uncharacterized protein (TIGR02246 family)